MDQARRVIVTSPDDRESDERWHRETAFLSDQIARELPVGPDSVILDYGCGAGRLARAVLERLTCSVLGVDISPSMLKLAEDYVASPRFVAAPTGLLHDLVEQYREIDHALLIWVLQHCPSPDDDLALIHRLLKPGGLLFYANSRNRCLPTRTGFIDDGIDVVPLLRHHFTKLKDLAFPEILTEVVGSPAGLIRVPLNVTSVLSVWQKT